MSEPVLTESQLDDYVRERVEAFVISGQSHGSKMIHVPNSDDDVGPVCGTLLRSDGIWLSKSKPLYPPGFHPICKRCVRRHFDVEVVEG